MQSQPQAARHFKVSRVQNCENRSNLKSTSVQLDLANVNSVILNSLLFQSQIYFPWINAHSSYFEPVFCFPGESLK